MKILFVGNGDPPPTFISRLLQGLNKAGIITLNYTHKQQNRYLSALINQWRMMVHLPEDTRKGIRDADIIHYQWPSHLIAYYPLFRRLNKPSVISLRGRQINVLPYVRGQQRYCRKLRRLLPKCDAYHCVSRAILEEARAFGLQEEKAWVIRPAVDPDFFTPANQKPPPPPLRVVMVGALMWRKGYDYALLGARQAITNGLAVEVNIIGDGPDLERISYTIQQLDLIKHVHLLGKKSPQEVKDHLQSSHILLHTSVSEGISNVVLEAMSCGLAVIAADVGGINEVITDKQNGLLIPSRDPVAVASNLQLLYHKPNLIFELGNSARQSVIKEHTLERQITQFQKMYQGVLNKNSTVNVS